MNKIRCWFGWHDMVTYTMKMPSWWTRPLIGHKCRHCGQVAPGQEGIEAMALASRPMMFVDEASKVTSKMFERVPR